MKANPKPKTAADLLLGQVVRLADELSAPATTQQQAQTQRAARNHMQNAGANFLGGLMEALVSDKPVEDALNDALGKAANSTDHTAEAPNSFIAQANALGMLWALDIVKNDRKEAAAKAAAEAPKPAAEATSKPADYNPWRKS